LSAGYEHADVLAVDGDEDRRADVSTAEADLVQPPVRRSYGP
jgi:hypothetical protein